jgi:hypothetical protein
MHLPPVSWRSAVERNGRAIVHIVGQQERRMACCSKLSVRENLAHGDIFYAQLEHRSPAQDVLFEQYV